MRDPDADRAVAARRLTTAPRLSHRLAALGAAIGLALAHIISAVGIPMPPPPNSNLEFVARIRIVPSVVAGAFTIGLVATVLASIPAAIRASRMPIVDALRRLA